VSQAGIVDIVGTHPQIPILFVCNVGSAVPIGNTLEVLGSVVAAHSIPLETVGSGNTVNIEVQYAAAAASSVGTNAGVASFNSADFTVDANGYVTLVGTAAASSFQVDASTAPGTNPVIPNGSGVVTITGGQVAAGTTTNVIRTNSLAANTYTVQIQRSQAVGVSTVGDNGVCHFNSTYFTVDSNGFVSINGSGIGETITGTIGGALSPTAGNWNILGSSTAAGTTPVQTSGSVSTLTVQVQKSQAIAATDATKVGLAAFDSARFSVDANGFVTLAGTGAGETITGNSGGALAPTAGNWNILGTGSITTSGSVSTLTVQLTGLTNHAVQVGAGTATLTQVGPTATTGAILQNNAGADPSYSTASYPSTTTINQILYSSAANVVTGLATANSAVLVTTSTGVPGFSGTMTNGQVIIGSTGATPTAATLTAGTGISIVNGAGSITINSTAGGFLWNNQTADLNPLVVENGYAANKAGTACSMTLPTGATFGDTIKIMGFGATGWVLNAGTGQTIQIGSGSTSVAGSITSTNQYDQLTVTCSPTTTTWVAQSWVGNLTTA
jgi:trimeric autotransporter adhesin